MTTALMEEKETATWIPLCPNLDDQASQQYFVEVASELSELAENGYSNGIASVRTLRQRALHEAKMRLGSDCQPVRLALSIVCDLVCQGWRVRVENGQVGICRPNAENDHQDEKARVRRSLLLARDEQLCEPAVRAFVQSMEARRLGPHGWCSILSLMRDGAELGEKLREVTKNRKGKHPDDLDPLEGVIKPYLQFVTEDARCEWTGLRLSDIWRYFRYTWLTPARSTPGRSMMILVRDAAVEPHPVIGIAALSSSIVQQSQRDRWIGWDKDSLLAELENNPTKELAQWLWRSLNDIIKGIAVDDFIEEGIITPADFETPCPQAISRLTELGLKEKKKHQTHARNLTYKKQQTGDRWSDLVKSHLYRSKRALTIADLLSIRQSFLAAGFDASTLKKLDASRQSTDFRKAATRLLRYIKATRVGINMMDISVAGSIAPYNALLGGKLVSLLLTSPEVCEAYAQRYGKTPSVIASGMKGKPVNRKPDLVLLCTTGLFGGGSSQYNRVRVPAQAVGGRAGEVKFLRLAENTSYGTFHFSQATMREMKLFIEQRHNGSDVHGIFGEGVNPKMRKIRETLYKLDFPDDALLQTGSPRSLYVIALAHNFREILSGRSNKPDYILPSEHPQKMTQKIVTFWRDRWLRERIMRADVIESVEAHTLTYPLRHGAVVALPENAEENMKLFEEFLELSEVELISE